MPQEPKPGGTLRSKRSILLLVGLVLVGIGCLLLANPLNNEPLWMQWGLGFAFFYLGLPLILIGAAIYFVSFTGPKDPFSS